MKIKLPFVSIVISTYNGEKRIKETIRALLKQSYPRESYEIIVVDDNSNDNTAKIVKGLPVKLVVHQNNLGRYAARNTGLKYSKGEIIAYIDDDCIADKNWLKNIILTYTNKEIVAVGGSIKPFYFDSLVDKYSSEIGHEPPSKDFRKSKNPLFRFYVYLKEKIFNLDKKDEEILEVGAIYANASFRKSLFNDIGLWDERLKFRGDTDFCNRISKKKNNNKIFFNKNAVITHKHKIKSLRSLLKDNFLRSKYTLMIYKKDKRIPPIFPFPLITIFFSIFLAFFNIWFLPLSLILLPQILYFWWPIKFIRKLKFYYLVFPYIQLSLEFFTILGILRGYILMKREHNKKLKQKKK